MRCRLNIKKALDIIYSKYYNLKELVKYFFLTKVD